MVAPCRALRDCLFVGSSAGNIRFRNDKVFVEVPSIQDFEKLDLGETLNMVLSTPMLGLGKRSDTCSRCEGMVRVCAGILGAYQANPLKAFRG